MGHEQRRRGIVLEASGVQDLRALTGSRDPDLLREAGDLITLTRFKIAAALKDPVVAPVALAPEKSLGAELAARLGAIALVGGALLLMALVLALLASARSVPAPLPAVVDMPQIELPAAAILPAIVPAPRPAVVEAPAPLEPVHARSAAPRYQRGHERTHAGLTREQVGAGLKAVSAAVRSCKAGAGFATVEVVIRGTGKVASASVSGFDHGDPAARCVSREVRKARFPEFDGKPIAVSYPFRL
jgi:hypothetical protein